MIELVGLLTETKGLVNIQVEILCMVYTCKHVYSTLHSEGSRRGREEREGNPDPPVKHKHTQNE